GSAGVFMRAVLGIIFMYLMVISFEIFGVVGPLFISVLFLVSYSVPFVYQIMLMHREKRETNKVIESPALRSQLDTHARFHDKNK
ncbi:hypothetical protein ACFL17_03940, partial [Pseudomonadota bacterium]